MCFFLRGPKFTNISEDSRCLRLVPLSQVGVLMKEGMGGLILLSFKVLCRLMGTACASGKLISTQSNSPELEPRVLRQTHMGRAERRAFFTSRNLKIGKVYLCTSLQ